MRTDSKDVKCLLQDLKSKKEEALQTDETNSLNKNERNLKKSKRSVEAGEMNKK